MVNIRHPLERLLVCPAGVRAGHWFTVKTQDGVTSLQHRPDLLQRAEPVICAFDIETTKLPLRFPNSAYDQVRTPRQASVACVVPRASCRHYPPSLLHTDPVQVGC